MKNKVQMIIKLFFIVSIFLSQNLYAQPRVEILNHQLMVDGQSQPQLFGAEVQYFRLRGGYGPNIPRADVLALWNKALDHFVEAKMNAISFYIPWDFHEYAEGQFDFTGTADQDGDGRADYPSRDLMTFFKMLEKRGIKRIMVRPGPYINAEWGFLGFGAIPSWFHDKYPDSHMRTAFGQRSRLYDYHNPDLLRHTELWFKALNEQVLAQHMGPGKPIIFLQLDNETNYQWQSIFVHDFGRRAISRYQDYLKSTYKDISSVNQDHGRQWERWSQVQPAFAPGRNIKEDQAWYRFSDFSIYSFLGRVRQIWQRIGIHEPDVLFTLAESFNAPLNGILPNYKYRNAPGVTGLMTVNLYPKTFEESHRPLLNSPFKTDFDVKAADEASDVYLGSRQEWVMGPEIQGGWWRGIEITRESRQQTYLTVLGHGMKALFIYYFNEGQNWDVEWSHKQIQPLFEGLRYEKHLINVPTKELPEDFWNELQARSDRNILVGFDVRRIMKLGPDHDQELFFDAPLDGKANPRAHFTHLKKIGEQIVFPYQDFLARSLEVTDNVALIRDNASHQPAEDRNLPYHLAAGDWTGGLLGALMNADINPQILHGDLSPESNLQNSKVLVHLDTGNNDPRTLGLLRAALNQGQTLINFLTSDVPRNLQIEIPASVLFERNQKLTPLVFYIDQKNRITTAGTPGAKAVTFLSSNPVYNYDESAFKKNNCEGILYWGDKPVGYRCQLGKGVLIQIGALMFEHYNSGAYADMQSMKEQRLFLKSLFNEANVEPSLKLSHESVRTVAFARKDPKQKILWITVKTGSKIAQKQNLRISQKLISESLGEATTFKITDLMSKVSQQISRTELIEKGFTVKLDPHGSTVFVVEK